MVNRKSVLKGWQFWQNLNLTTPHTMEMVIGASIFFSDNFWTQDECLYESNNGDLVIVKLVGKNLSVIVSNVYTPNQGKASLSNDP